MLKHNQKNHLKEKYKQSKSVSPKTNLFSKLVKAVALNGDLNAVKRLIKMGVFEHPVDKKTRDDLAKLSIYEILRSRNEREKQGRVKIFEIFSTTRRPF